MQKIIFSTLILSCFITACASQTPSTSVERTTASQTVAAIDDSAKATAVVDETAAPKKPAANTREVLNRMMKVGGNYDPRANLVVLYRGTKQEELVDLKNLKATIDGGNMEAALFQANQMAQDYNSGLHFSSSKKAAVRDSKDQDEPTVMTIKIRKNTLDRLVASRKVVADYENKTFVLDFQSGSAILEVAKSLQIDRGD